MVQQNEPRVELELRRAASRAGWERLWRWLLAGVAIPEGDEQAEPLEPESAGDDLDDVTLDSED